MPIFEYHCENCDCNFEEIILDDQDPPCPECGQQKAKRLMSTAVTRGLKKNTASAPAKGGGCSGCSGGSCSTCH